MSVIGLKVGPFEIVDHAAVPEPGAWYVARRSGGEGTALVRLVSPGEPAERAAVQRQVEVLRGLEDPRVPAVLGWYEGLGAVALHDTRGIPLADAVRERGGDLALSPATLLDLLVALAETLQRAHHRNRVHGHLDGTNVVLAADGTLWVVGWGTDRPSTPGWCPPEIARGERAMPATDQWSLAALGAALVSGRIPWAEPESPVTGLPGGVLAPVERQWIALGRIFRRMLDTKPGARFPSMHAARAELLALSRQVRAPSDRRAFAAALARRVALQPAPSPAQPERDTSAAITSPVGVAPEPSVALSRPPDVFAAWSDDDDAWAASPTAVPATDSGDETDEEPPPTDPIPPAAFRQWFDPSPADTFRPEPVLPTDSDPLPPRRPARVEAPDRVSPRVVAVVLTAVWIVLVLVWLAARIT
jgi:serine/threonine protein kinase